MLVMTKFDWCSRLTKRPSSRSGGDWIAARAGLAALLLSAGFAVAQTPAPAAQAPAAPAAAAPAAAAPAAAAPAPAAPAAAEPAASVPAAPNQVVENGYVVRQTADLGGHFVGVSGSGAMYNTLVN